MLLVMQNIEETIKYESIKFNDMQINLISKMIKQP